MDDFRADVRSRLASPGVQRELAALAANGEREPDARALYRELGRQGLLAVGWPRAYGGDGRGVRERAVVAEELVRAGVPDTLHVNSVQIVATFLLLAGSAAQKQRYLPAFGRGERFASVLYTEPDAGSDLSALRTTATREPDGYRLTGTKVFSLKTDVADFGLCAARTSPAANRYEGISLFLVDLRAQGVRRTVIPSIADEQFHRVELDGVLVPAEALVGPENGGWPLLAEALAIERTGLDYALKAERWLDAVLAGLDGPTDAVLVETGRLGAAVEAAHLLSQRVLDRQAAGDIDVVAAAAAKLFASELARDVAGWAVRVHGYGFRARSARTPAPVLDAAVREAPGLTISAGTSEVMLEIVASAGLDRPEADGRTDEDDDAAVRALRRTLRAGLAAAGGAGSAAADPHGWIDGTGPDSPAWPVLRRLGAPALELPVDAGGLDLGLETGVLICEELGRTALDGPYRGTMLVADALLAAGAARTGELTAICAGERTATVLGLFADPTTAGLSAARTAGGWFVRGCLPADPAAGADLIGFPLDLGGTGVFALVPADRPGWTATGGRGQPLVTFDRLRIGEADIVCRWPSSASADTGANADAARALLRARVRHAGYLTGLAAGALDLTVAHTGRRRQFGKPLLEFQSVGFRLAEVRVLVDASEALVRRAARLADAAGGGEAATAADEALAAATETALDVTRSAMQLHGVRAMTAWARVHRHYRRALVESGRLGTVDLAWRRAGADRLRRRDDQGGSGSSRKAGYEESARTASSMLSSAAR